LTGLVGSVVFYISVSNLLMYFYRLQGNGVVVSLQTFSTNKAILGY